MELPSMDSSSTHTLRVEPDDPGPGRAAGIDRGGYGPGKLLGSAQKGRNLGNSRYLRWLAPA